MTMNKVTALIIAETSVDMEVLIVKSDDIWELPEADIAEENQAKQQCLELVQQFGISVATNQLYELGARKGRYCFLIYLDKKKDVIKGEFKPLLMVKELRPPHGAILCEGLGCFWQIMPSFINNLRRVELPPLFVKKQIDHSRDEVVFYGGSFNPWHGGHMACLEACPSSHIVVVPDYNPWKESQEHEKRCFWSEYRKLCLILKDTPYAVYSGFWGLDDPNPTVDWIPNIKTQNKGLLLGDDSFCNILKWRNSERLVTFLNMIYVVPRIHKKKEMEKVRDEVLKLHPSMTIKILPEHEFMHESSTLIREKTRKLSIV